MQTQMAMWNAAQRKGVNEALACCCGMFEGGTGAARQVGARDSATIDIKVPLGRGAWSVGSMECEERKGEER